MPMYVNFKSGNFYYIAVIMILGRGDVSKNVLYESGDRDDLPRVVFSTWLLSILSAIKRLLVAMDVKCSGMTSLKFLV